MSYLSWHVGMKVVYIGGPTENPPQTGERRPEVGKIYTVRQICTDGIIVGIRLVEIINPQNPNRRTCSEGSREYGFRATRFRPVQTRKTDISVFTAMLNPSKRSVDA